MNNSDKINELLIKYYDYVYTIIDKRYIHDCYVSEELCQETFIKFLKNYHKFRGDSDIKTWLTKIAINTALDYLKRENKAGCFYYFESFDSDNLEYDILRYNNIKNYEDKMCIKTIVNDMPQKMSSVINCIYFAGFSLKETALLLNIPEGTVKSRVYKAKEYIRRKMQM